MVAEKEKPMAKINTLDKGELDIKRTRSTSTCRKKL